ncbi:DUF4031 domain-containing protein [Maricaulis sp.]|uniref:DUF4031 domain-containing protein n=1 Tax=Maricaulis sp. TaxID=1486257 RepID=UPI003A9259D2
MTVYVDPAIWPYGRMMMCHMTADSLGELHDMASALGIARRWFQCPPKASMPHYDICKSKRALAIELGAREVTRRGGVFAARQLLAEWRELEGAR